MLVSTVNRFARGMDYPSLVGPDSINLATTIAAPGTDFTNSSYGMNGSLRKRAGLGNFAAGDYTTIGDYFTSANYYLGFVALAGLAFLFIGGGSSKAKRRAIGRRATLKGAIAREQELLKAS